MDPYQDDDNGIRRESMAFTTLIVQSEDASSALEKMKERIIELQEEDERFFGVLDFYLDEFVEIDDVGSSAKDISWMSLVPFGESFAQLRYHKQDDPSFRHYVLRSCFDRFPNRIGQDPAVNLRLVPVEDDDGQDEEVVPLVSLSRDRRQIKPLYKELRKRKFRGTLPDFQELSDGDLYELYVVEGCLSAEIADLFEVKRSKVDYRRRKIGATPDEKTTYDMLRGLDVLEPIPYKSLDEQD